jgi:predicted molibdopterin-dependent oxidoreductase YjgC
MDQIKLTIDGQEIETQAGTTILEVARGVDIYIPSLCSHPDLGWTYISQAFVLIRIFPRLKEFRRQR